MDWANYFWSLPVYGTTRLLLVLELNQDKPSSCVRSFTMSLIFS